MTTTTIPYGLRSIIVRPLKPVKGPSGRAYWHLSAGLKFRRFRWQWAVQVDVVAAWGASHQETTWRTIIETFENRKQAREYIRSHNGMPNYRNFKIKRRLIEVDWHEYTDTYGWNKGRGKR